MKATAKAILVTAIRVLFSVFALPFLYLLKPFVFIKFCLIPNQRIGHLVGNTDTFLRNLKNEPGSQRAFYLFFIWDPANQQIVEMFKRELTIIQSKALTRLYYAIRPILIKTGFFVRIRSTLVPHMRAANLYPAVLTLNAREEEVGRRHLDDMGVGEDDWFACFHARDSRYLDVWRPQYKNLWGKSDYRNSDINEFTEAANYLTSLGGYVLRMGAVVEEPLDAGSNPKIIDYATRYRSDFMDIYLSAKCKFFLVTNTGMVYAPAAFDTPVAMANAVPYFIVPPGRGNLFAPKLLFLENENRYLSFPEAKDKGLFASDMNHDYPALCQDLGLRQIDNTADEIRDLCEDMMDKLARRIPSKEAVRLQELYNDRYLSDLPYYEKVGARIGASFALKYKDLIDPPH